MSRWQDEKFDEESRMLEHASKLYGYAFALTRNRGEAEDLVQETYIRAIEAMERLRPGSNLKGWMFTILRNIWLNGLRSRRSTPDIVSIDEQKSKIVTVVETSRDPFAHYASTVECDQVRGAIRQLSSDLCQIILLREYEDLSYQEIAEIMDCPVGTVMSRLARARSKLRSLLEPILQLSPRQIKHQRTIDNPRRVVTQLTLPSAD